MLAPKFQLASTFLQWTVHQDGIYCHKFLTKCKNYHQVQKFTWEHEQHTHTQTTLHLTGLLFFLQESFVCMATFRVQKVCRSYCILVLECFNAAAKVGSYSHSSPTKTSSISCMACQIFSSMRKLKNLCARLLLLWTFGVNLLLLHLLILCL